MTGRNPAGGIALRSTRVMNLASFLTQASRRHGDEIALVWRDRTWSWADLEARVEAMAAALRERFGVVKGDRILVQSQNCNQLFESMFACFRLGAVWVPANFRQTPDEVAYLAQSSGAVGMICNAAFPDHAAAARRQSNALRFLVSIEPSAFGESYDALVDSHRGQPVAAAPVDRDDPCWFFYTSGTTGRPKAAVLTHGQMAFVVTNHLCDLMPGTTNRDASLVVAPLSHGAGIHQLVQVAKGAKTVLLPTEKLDVPAAWALVERWRVSNMFTVPTILKMLVEDPSVSHADRSSLRYVIYAGAPMYRADQKRILEVLGPVIVQYYGLGEVTGNITVFPASMHAADDSRDLRPGTCGLERVGMSVSIQDADGREVAPGETGEICVIGPAVFAGYYDNPEANAQAFRNGWFRTGDLGRMDAEGFLYITGRNSDMYISGGSNIYPREIEEKILMHPAIREVAVVGVPHEKWGEAGAAAIVLNDGCALTGDELKDWLKGQIAAYKMPSHVEIFDELPKSGYGKITKKLVKEALDARRAGS
ncbi:acyl-CoA synthetase [Oceanibacterium hippocampi]|uniref:Long-chain-fatty-acid--CoA ligase n=1 Tax=Oceanibacterium hippocampi TaxID=745714 RepID=A0A1Y5U004_9PROT|nr:acyl-CoA synthetase [Oceanibacterium hippocampi]SLN75671.1 Long-chain-fatty-acid--CoA ligase [Oceanibacterium hippocampi]